MRLRACDGLERAAPIGHELHGRWRSRPAASVWEVDSRGVHRRPHRTAQLIGVRVAVVLWRDDGYGLIDRKQADESGRRFLVRFGNPDLLEDAQSFGIVAFRPESVAGLHPTLRRALDVDSVSLVDVLSRTPRTS